MKYLRRLVWYIASRLVLILLALSLMIVTFYYAMNVANISVVLKDGMAYRAQVVMMMEDGSDLNKYFSQSLLDTDETLAMVNQGTSPYRDYNVRGIDHRLSMESMWCWPWDDTATATFTERVPRIDGRAKASTADALIASGGAEAIYPPAWAGHRYRAALVKENGQWRIKSMTRIGDLSAE